MAPRGPKTKLPPALEEDLAAWWEQYPQLYDLNHTLWPRNDLKKEILRLKIRDLQESEEWYQDENVRNMTIESLQKWMSNIRDFLTKKDRQQGSSGQAANPSSLHQRRKRLFGFLR